jgi:branched-chain amino acid transport system substrate-binding protein
LENLSASISRRPGRRDPGRARRRYAAAGGGGGRTVALLLACWLALTHLPGRPATAGPPPIRVALVLALSGIAADDNRPAIDAARLAVEEINAAGGAAGSSLELMLIDNLSTPIGAKMAAEKAIEMEAAAVVGALWSSHALPMAQVLQKAAVPMITPTASMPEITRVGDYIFRACFTDSFQGLVMARFSFHDLGVRRAVVLYNVNEAYSQNLSEHFALNFDRLGGQLLGRLGYKGSAADFSPQIALLKALQPQAVFLPGYTRDSGLLIRQARKMGIEAIFLGGDSWGAHIHEIVGPEWMGEAYFSTFWHPEVPFPRNDHLKRAYRDRYGTGAFDDMRIPLTYDAFMLLAEAIGRAGSGERRAIRAALAETRHFQGATGTITFDPNGDPVDKEASISRFDHGHWRFLKSVAP